jgi:hypothetical protein
MENSVLEAVGAGVAVSLALGFALGWMLKNRLHRGDVQSAKNESREIIAQTRREAED